MGQLEKYGLYVLCLVIFLILGVTIWGGGDAQPGKSPAASIRSPGPAPAAAGVTPAGGAGGNGLRSLADALLDPSKDPGRPAPRPNEGAGKADAGKSGTANPANPASPAAPEAKPEPKAEPKADAKVVYRVQDGDTFDSIARSKLGKASWSAEIMKLNPGIEPKKLRPGMDIQLPSAASLAAATTREARADEKKTADKIVPPIADGGRSYVVKKGDNFERIAVAELGSRRRISELLELNSGIDPTKLKPGMSLKLPKK
jgi:nucleoid-associated protein YgaU